MKKMKEEDNFKVFKRKGSGCIGWMFIGYHFIAVPTTDLKKSFFAMKKISAK